MKSYLMFKGQDFDPEQALPEQHEDLIKDLALEVLLKAMADDDDFIYEISKITLLNSLDDAEAIRFRQDVLKDCLKNPQIVRKIYRISQQSKETKHRRWLGILSRTPSGILSSAVKLMMLFSELLKALKAIGVVSADQFESEGFSRFFSMIKREITEDYLAAMDDHLNQLRFKSGVWISAKLGQGNQGEAYNLRRPKKKYRNFFKSLIKSLTNRMTAYAFMVDPRDQAGGRALSDLQDRGLNEVANALAQSAEHVDSFFENLRIELAFYVGCLNLFNRINGLNCPVTIPKISAPHQQTHQFLSLSEICLALTQNAAVVGNDVDADGCGLFVITGANQGGKSTFLRSIGLAQLMMQAGMFVAAQEFSANLCQGIYTHFIRQEDDTMKSGKLDEELARMSRIVDIIEPNSLILFNESFSATNEREGSEIGRQILTALLDHDIKVFLVTHMYELANAFSHHQTESTLFLRAERKEDGTRTFKLVEGKPLQTSFAEDVFHEVFNDVSNEA